MATASGIGRITAIARGGSFRQDAERLIQAADVLEAHGYRVCAGYLTHTPLRAVYS